MVNSFRRVLIVADESADWVVAGLRQLERLALAVDEFAVENRETAPVFVCIFWRPDLDRSQRWVPRHARLTKVAFTQDLDGQAYDLVLNTRLFLYRGAVRNLLPEGRASARPPTFAAEFFGNEDVRKHVPPSEEELWQAWFRSLESLPPSQPGAWEYITTGDQIDGIEIRFLRGSGKSQDGLVSRYLNRPISRRVTRLFLRFPTTPNGWTWSIFIIPLLALLVLFQGTYWSFVWGLVLYQIFSVLDGCDGELARAKFLESERGRRLDAFCDVLSNILLVLGLGGGLSRQAALAGSSGWFYFLEGVVAAALIGVNESWLEMKNSSSGQEKALSLGDTVYPRHRELVERSGLLALGGNFASWVIQLTKRDVAVLFFVFLALIGLPAVILHLLFVVTAVTLALSFKSLSRS
jgi:hypothetical protein